jgi:hypothetical protein
MRFGVISINEIRSVEGNINSNIPHIFLNANHACAPFALTVLNVDNCVSHCGSVGNAG